MDNPRIPPESGQPGYERRDVNIRAVLWLAVATAVGAGIVHVGLAVLLHGYDVQARRADPQLPPLAAEPSPVRGLRLQATPLADYEHFRQEQKRLASSYGWVDRQQGVVRVPIERAMELYLAHRQPPTESATPAPPEKQP